MTPIFKRSSRYSRAEEELLNLKPILDELKETGEIREIYLIGQRSCDSEESLESTKQQIRKADVDNLAGYINVDVQRDIVKIFLLVDEYKNSHLLGVNDPLELYENPTIVAKLMNINSKTRFEIEHKEFKRLL